MEIVFLNSLNFYNDDILRNAITHTFHTAYNLCMQVPNQLHTIALYATQPVCSLTCKKFLLSNCFATKVHLRNTMKACANVLL